MDHIFHIERNLAKVIIIFHKGFSPSIEFLLKYFAKKICGFSVIISKCFSQIMCVWI